MRNLSFKPFVLSVSIYRGDNECTSTRFEQGLLLGPGSSIFDVIGGNQGWYDTRPCELYKAY